MTPADRDAAVALANLRHAYAQLHEGRVRDQREFACGLVGPAIKTLERALAERPTCATCQHYSLHGGEAGFCGHIRLWRPPDWHCADHEPTPLPSCSICRRDDCGGNHACE